MAPPTYLGLAGQKLSMAVTATATTGFLLFGYDQGVMSGIISARPFNDMFEATRDNSTMQGFVTAIYEIGCLLGALFMLVFGDRLGRRKGIITGALIMLLGVIIQIASVRGSLPLVTLITGRTVMGFGNGMNTSTIPTYQAECSKSTNRGLLLCSEGAIIAFGSLLAYWLDFGASYGSDEFSWRFPIAFQILFALFIAIPMYFLPESPRWLLTHQRQDEADRVIAALRGYELDSPETRLERDLVVDSIQASGGFAKSTPYKALLTSGKTQHLRRALIGSGAQIMQQLGGCNAVIYFAPILFETDIKPGDHHFSLLLGGCVMIVYTAGAALSLFLIERVGRRRLLLVGTLGQMVSMIITFACLIPKSSTAANGAAFGIFLYIFSFGTSWLPIPWILAAEISPTKTRAKANAVSTMCNWSFNFLVVLITPIMLDSIGWGTYLFFAAMNAIFLPIIYFFFPETAQRSLEELDIVFAKGYDEKISYVKAAKQLPQLAPEEIESYALRYGLVEDAERIHNLRSRGAARAHNADDEEKGVLSDQVSNTVVGSDSNENVSTKQG